jgi:hypothetical protein
MKRGVILSIVILFTLVFTQSAFPQFQNQPTKPNISNILNNPMGNIMGGLLNPEKFQMHHTVSMSFGNFFGQSLMLSSYMNTINYQFSDKLNLQANLGIMSSPYNTFGKDFYLNKPQFFGSAQLNYRLNDNAHLMLRIESSPFGYGYGNGYGYGLYTPFLDERFPTNHSNDTH